jgi:hypothetical protein
MTPEQILWTKEQGFWQAMRSGLDDRQLTRDADTAVLTYRIASRGGPVRCTSTYARDSGHWMLVEHHQAAA